MKLHWQKRHRSYVAHAGLLRLVVKQKPLTLGGQWFAREVFGNQFFGMDRRFPEPVAAMREAERMGRFMLRSAQKALSPKKRSR